MKKTPTLLDLYEAIKPKYYLKVNLPPNFNDLDAEVIKTDLMAYINNKNQYGAMYGPKSHTYNTYFIHFQTI